MSISKIFAYIFTAVALIFEGFFGIIPFIQFLLQIVVIAFAMYFFVSLFRRKAPMIWREVVVRYIIAMTATIGFFTTLFLSFIGYHHLVPGVVSDITLSHSGQEVVFIGMSHIATPEFYSIKQQKIASLAQSGYTILVEWVKPGTPENQTIFNQSMGFDFTPTLYSKIASVINLQSQDNKMLYSGILTGSLESIDLSIDEIVALMWTGWITSTGNIVNLEWEIQETLSKASKQELLFTGWVARWLLNWSLKQSDDIETVLTSGLQAQLFSTIIDRRNDKIIEYIQNNPDKKIAIVYGALHFNGIYEALQKIDSSWKTINVDISTPYK